MFTMQRSFYLRPTDQIVPSQQIPQDQAIAYLRPRSDGRVEYLCFCGRRAKPAAHYLAKNADQAAARIEEFYAQTAHGLELKAAWRARKADAKAKAKAEFAGVAGSVFVQSWGWEQTNVTCYQMTRRVSPTVIEAVEIGTIQDSSDWTGPMSDHCQPDPVSAEEANSLPKIRMRISDSDSVRVPRTAGYSWGQDAHLWDGKRSYYRSWYA